MLPSDRCAVMTMLDAPWLLLLLLPVVAVAVACFCMQNKSEKYMKMTGNPVNLQVFHTVPVLARTVCQAPATTKKTKYRFE